MAPAYQMKPVSTPEAPRLIFAAAPLEIILRYQREVKYHRPRGGVYVSRPMLIRS